MKHPSHRRAVIVFGAAVLLALSTASCKIVKNEQKEAKQDGKIDIFFVDEKFNPDKAVDELWASKIPSYVARHAVDVKQVLSALADDPLTAGKQYGKREKPEGSPWNYIVKGKAKIVDVNTKSRASTVSLDVEPFDGNPDLLMQIGPVIKGTAIRDSLEFIKFDDFNNQLEFARFSGALHKRVNADVLKDLNRDALQGRTLSFSGMFTDPGKGRDILLTPVVLDIQGGE